jgi:hypothetical protein
MVQIRHGQEAPPQAELAARQVLCHWTMARRVSEVVRVAARQPAFLTRALRLVLRRAPAALEWKQLRCPTSKQQLAASFEAVGGDGRLYSINCLDGAVLEDGCPPHRLPLEILDHPLYRRSFGDWSFEVTVTAGGVRRAISPVRGRFYEFAMGPDGGLVVVEEDERQNRTQLLDVGKEQRCEEWGGELPVRLRELYSHWLSRWGGVGLCAWGSL